MIANADKWQWISIIASVFLGGNLLISECCGDDVLQPDASLDPIRQTVAYAELLHSKVWIDAERYGFSGEEVNKAAIALRALIKEPRAREILLELLDRATPAGQLYALCGLYRVDQGVFFNKVEPFCTITNTVISIYADVEINERICDIVFAPCHICGKSAGEILNDARILAVCLSTHKRNGDKFLVQDIVGGRYPRKLIDGW